MNTITIVGLCAAICTTTSFLPQAIKTIKTKNTKDIALSMYVLMFVGILLWLTYGILIKDLPIILANVASSILSGIVLVMKLKHG